MIPTWNVFIVDDEVKQFNIFDHSHFFKECCKAFAECKHDKDVFAKMVESELRYWYWSKCEWELIISGFVRNNIERKIDVYEQVMLNWDRFIDYLWDWYTHTVRYYSKERGISNAFYIYDE